MANSNTIPLKRYSGSRFQVGQVWQYRTRLNDIKSVLQIVEVDLLHSKEIAVHIQVRGLNMQSSPTEPNEGIASHLPFSEEAIEASVTNLLQQDSPLPDDFEEGYEVWREAFLEGNAGIFSVTVAEVIDMIDDTMLNGNKSE
jgi:hypothetical protein